MRRAATLLFCFVAAGFIAAGCSNAAIGVQLRVPPGDHPLAGADHVALTLRDATGTTLAFARAAAGNDALTLPGVAAGSGYTVEVDATFAGDVVARGRSCRFTVDASKPPAVPVWFSRVGRFATTAGPAFARADATVFRWGTGALVAGGTSAGAVMASTELYDPVAGHFLDGRSFRNVKDKPEWRPAAQRRPEGCSDGPGAGRTARRRG